MELSDQGVSRIHATFTVRGDAAFVRDAGSRNGTYVNGTRIARPVRLTPGDVVALGAVRMRYSLDSEEELARLNQLRDAALRDHLTGTYNRRHFEERLASELAYAVRHGTTLALLLLDLDCFKRINDEHGHPAGDAVLRAFAQMLLKNVRTEDVVARWGGEEFVVLARGTDGRGGVILGERLRRGALQLRIPVNGVELCISTSIGVSAVTPGVTGVNALQLLRLADLALYEAKHAGRNRVVDVDSLPSAKLTPIDKSTRRR